MNGRLATRVVIAEAVFLALLLAIIVMSSFRSTQERRQAEIDNAVAMGQIVDGFGQDLQTTTLAVSIALATRPVPFEQERDGPYLKTLAEQYGMPRGLFITDTNARVVATQAGEGLGSTFLHGPTCRASWRGRPRSGRPAWQGSRQVT